MMGRSAQCYIPGFVEIGPPVPEKKVFEGYLPYNFIMGMEAILVMCPASCQQIFISLHLKACIQNLVQNGPVVSEKLVSIFMTFGQGQEMILNFNTQLPSITQLFVCIYYLSGHRLLYFLKNPLFSLFPIERSRTA